MNDATSLVLIVTTLGWLVLAVSGYRAHRVSGRKTLLLAAAWGAIILGLFFLFTVLGV